MLIKKCTALHFVQCLNVKSISDPWGNSGPATQPSASWPASNAPTDPWGNSPPATTQAPPAADPFGAPKNDPFGNAGTSFIDFQDKLLSILIENLMFC